MTKAKQPTRAPAKMAIFDVPESDVLLAAVGEVTIRHAQLDHILKLTIKNLAELNLVEALDAMEGTTSRELRRRVIAFAAARLGDSPAFLKLEALVKRCQRVTRRRNKLVHGVWARELPNGKLVVHRSGEWKRPAGVDELRKLAEDIRQLTVEISNARSGGFLQEALLNAPPAKPGTVRGGESPE